MIKAYKISMLEKYAPFEAVKVAADYMNGTFGTVSDGVFTAGAAPTHFLYQVGRGDENYTDFTIPKDSDARAASLDVWNGKELFIEGANLPASVEEDSKLDFDANGALKVNASPSGTYLQVTKLLGEGAVAVITKNA